MGRERQNFSGEFTARVVLTALIRYTQEDLRRKT